MEDVELNEGGEGGPSRWLLERRRQKQGSSSYGSGGWVQIRSCGRDSGGLRGGFRREEERDPVKELWERLTRVRLEQRERKGREKGW